MNATASPTCPHCGGERELWPRLDGPGYRALCPACDVDETATDLETYRLELERALSGEPLTSQFKPETPSAPAADLRRCPHCDAAVAPEAEVCPWCGRSLTTHRA